MDYFFLRQNLFGSATGIEITGHTERSAEFNWVDGVMFSRPFPPETFLLDDAYGSNYPDYFDTSVPVMSNRLIAALRACGVSNLDDYPVTLRNPGTGAERIDYAAVNLVGLVDAVDLATSVHEMRRGKPKFTGAIAITESRTSGLLAFRLPVSPRFMVVAASVAAQIGAGNFDSVLLQPTLAYRGT